MDVTGPHVWWVAHNEFEFTAHGVHYIHAYEIYRRSQQRRICSGDLKRCLGNVSTENTGSWNFQGQRYCNTSGTCADVQNSRLRSLAGGFLDFQDGFDDVFGFGPRNQYSGCDSKVTSIEFLPADDVLKGNAIDAVIHSFFERLSFQLGKHAIIVSVEIFPLD